MQINFEVTQTSKASFELIVGKLQQSLYSYTTSIHVLGEIQIMQYSSQEPLK